MRQIKEHKEVIEIKRNAKQFKALKRSNLLDQSRRNDSFATNNSSQERIESFVYKMTEDARRREDDQRRLRSHQRLKQEEEIKDYFKPKTNESERRKRWLSGSRKKRNSKSRIRAHDFTTWGSDQKSPTEIVNISTPQSSTFDKASPPKSVKSRTSKASPVQKSPPRDKSPLQVFNRLYKQNKHLMGSSKKKQGSVKKRKNSSAKKQRSPPVSAKKARPQRSKPKRRVIRMKPK